MILKLVIRLPCLAMPYSLRCNSIYRVHVLHCIRCTATHMCVCGFCRCSRHPYLDGMQHNNHRMCCVCVTVDRSVKHVLVDFSIVMWLFDCCFLHLFWYDESSSGWEYTFTINHKPMLLLMMTMTAMTTTIMTSKQRARALWFRTRFEGIAKYWTEHSLFIIAI